MINVFKSSINRWRGIVLGLWAAGLITILVAGRYSLFIRAQLWPLLLASVIILLLFLIAMIARPGRAPAGRITAGAWVRGGMLLLPVLYMGSLLSGAAASGLNSFALQKRSMGLGSASDPLAGGIGPDATPVDSSKSISLGVIARNLSRLSGTHVITEGRVWMDPSLPNGQMVIFRFVVVCCAADAMPVQAVVISPKTAACKNDDWVHVEGTLSVLNQDGQQIPVIQADQIVPIAAPEEPYLSPYQF